MAFRIQRRPQRGRILAALLGGAVAAVVSRAAKAHSELRRSFPANGALLDRAPDRLELAFNERVQLTGLRLFRDGGGELRWPERRPIRDTDRESIRFPDLEPGAYRVDWRIISADGHPVGGTIRFRYQP
jgi:methionine-rich copper-binding protein CopC